MKKSLKIIVIVILIILLIVIIKEIRDGIIFNKYDYIVGGDNCSCQLFGECKHTYGIKDGNVEELKIKIPRKIRREMPNFYPIQKLNNNIFAYLDMKTIEKSRYRGNWIKPVEEIISEYKYNKKDKDAFDRIVGLVGEEKVRDFDYFIITKKNYYVFDSIEESVYKYNKNNNSLDLVIELKECGIDYFHEK